MHAPTALPVDAHAQDGAAVAQALQSPDGGLSQAEAARRLDLHGRNALPEPPRRTLLVQLLAQFHGVLIYLLLGSAAIALALGHPVDALVVMLVVLINAAVGHVQEGRAEQALDAVRRMLTREAAVLRDGHRHIVLAEQLVPGDRILLEAGDRVPADVRLLRARNLRIDESALTGESVPVEKHCEPAAPDAPLGDRRSMAYS
ncbi:MAG TPA: HAD-IC family P-type ATPase, partial [Arenimonas sp.]|nr:HAD-IC family P-type ATPase [Arenimonas sp.]